MELEPESEPVDAMASKTKVDPWEFILRKYVLMLATLVATVTYAVGFNPPGGVWQENDGAAGHLAGEPIARTTNNLRYMLFFYCNAVALSSSVLVIVLFLFLSIDLVDKNEVWIRIKPLRVLMMLELLSFMGAYAAGSCRDMLTTIYIAVLMAAGVSTYLTVQVVLAWGSGPESPSVPADQDSIPDQVVLPWGSRPESPSVPADQDSIQDQVVLAWGSRPESPSVPADQGSIPDEITNNGVGIDLDFEGWLRKVLMLLATFAVSITYATGLNSPGGFWDNTGGGHRLGDAILSEGHHKARLTTFFICNSTSFMASLLIITLLLGRKIHEQTVRSREMFGCVLLGLLGLVGAYAAGSCREPGTTAYVVGVVAASLVCIRFLPKAYLWKETQETQETQEAGVVSIRRTKLRPGRYEIEEQMMSRSSRSILLSLATFAAPITYQAGLDLPGGVWQENGNGHLAGDPILLTMNATRYRTFLYCNSFTFVFSLVTIIGSLRRFQLKRQVVDKVIIVELLGLVGAYAAGACRDLNTSIYVMALAGAILLFVVIHVTIFRPDRCEIGLGDLAKVEKKRKLLYLLATLSTAMTYQAGLTPPGGFWLQDDNESGHDAGDPVLSYNHPRGYNAFFYCNSVSFMLSVTTMILMVSSELYRPAIQTRVLTLCTAAGLACTLGAYAAGSNQHPTTPIGIVVLVVLAFLILTVLLLIYFVRDICGVIPRASWRAKMKGLSLEDAILNQAKAEKKDQHWHRQRKYLMLLGILVAGVTYQAGLDPPGGVWQSDAGGHDAGSPAMQDNRRQRYLAFFYGNSTSFAASIVVILLLLLQSLNNKQGLHIRIRVMRLVVLLDLLALLAAYVAGSSRDGKSSMIIAAVAIFFLTCIAVYVVSAYRRQRYWQEFHRKRLREETIPGTGLM